MSPLDAANESQSKLTASEICQLINVASNDITNINLDLLDSDKERLAFFINLYNLIFTHGHMLLLSQKLDLNFEFGKKELEYLMENPFGRLLLHTKFKYRVGQLNIVRAFDLYQHILCGGVKSEFFGDGLQEDKSCE